MCNIDTPLIVQCVFYTFIPLKSVQYTLSYISSECISAVSSAPLLF